MPLPERFTADDVYRELTGREPESVDGRQPELTADEQRDLYRRLGLGDIDEWRETALSTTVGYAFSNLVGRIEQLEERAARDDELKAWRLERGT